MNLDKYELKKKKKLPKPKKLKEWKRQENQCYLYENLDWVFGCKKVA